MSRPAELSDNSDSAPSGLIWLTAPQNSNDSALQLQVWPIRSSKLDRPADFGLSRYLTPEAEYARDCGRDTPNDNNPLGSFW
jgi:hypothetical protein